jgi:hypothetical protein
LTEPRSCSLPWPADMAHAHLDSAAMIAAVHTLIYADDAEAARAKGAEFSRDIEDEGYGLTTVLKVPGAGKMMLYEPKHLAFRTSRLRLAPPSLGLFDGLDGDRRQFGGEFA